MDGLALLCNLFADGPVTLSRLRSAGVTSLSELERAAPLRLAEWLHSSAAQAQGFAEEGRKLVRRLAEEQLSAWRTPAETARKVSAPKESGSEETGTVTARVFAPAHEPAAVILPRARPAGPQPLQPGLLPGLDAALCARLAQSQVHTVQALSEFAGLALARRTGIPYSTLLELSRHARRHLAGRGREASAPALAPRSESASKRSELESRAEHGQHGQHELRQVELTPFAPRPRSAPLEREPARTDEFTLPLAEPESAGPFG